MHIEDIFEDLEAHFAAANLAPIQQSLTDNTRAIEVITSTLIPKELIAPIVGADFFAGLDSLAPIWHIIPMTSVNKVLFHQLNDTSLPSLRNFRIDLIGFLNAIPKPSSIRWRLSGPDSIIRMGQLHAVTGSLLFIYQIDAKRPFAVPIQALQSLSIESVDNLNGDF
jgi:hypothetical protein